MRAQMMAREVTAFRMCSLSLLIAGPREYSSSVTVFVLCGGGCYEICRGAAGFVAGWGGCVVGVRGAGCGGARPGSGGPDGEDQSGQADAGGAGPCQEGLWLRLCDLP